MHRLPHRHFKARAVRHAKVLTRHRAFAARFFGVRRSAQEVTALARVLRRSYLVTQQHGAPLHFSLHVAMRDAGSALAPRAALPAPGRTWLVRELLTREHCHVLRRSLHTNSVERVIAGRPQAPVARMVMAHRIERQLSFPRLALTIVRSSATVPVAALALPSGPAPAGALPQDARALDATRGAVAAPLVLAHPELARVTEHVIRQLDRRVLSYRERTGKV